MLTSLSWSQRCSCGLERPQYVLAGSTLEGAVAAVALGAVGDPVLGTLAVADEVEHHLHLLVEAQRPDLDAL